MSFVSVAIDGPSGAGKSTLARRAASELGYCYVDTGAIYRTVSLYAYRKGADAHDAAAVEALLPEIHIDLFYEADGVQHMLLNGEDVTGEIRSSEISLYTSAVSAIPAVRAFLLSLQRELARTRDVVMDGRDIGTTVLPNARVKVFLTAAPQARAHRRYLELKAAGSGITEAEVLRDVERRDYDDSHRAASPLRQAEDAVVLDTTDCGLEESGRRLLAIIRERV